MSRTSSVIMLMLLSCVALFGQSKYNNQIQPGLSTRSKAEQALGQPIRALGENQFEYNPPAGASRLMVEYRSGPNIVEQIETAFLRPHSRAVMIQSLNLPEQSLVQGMTKEGKLQEFFGEPAFLVFTYASGESSSGVIVLGYYSREQFERTSSIAGAQLRTFKGSSGTPVGQQASTAPIARPAPSNLAGQSGQGIAGPTEQPKPTAHPPATDTEPAMRSPAGERPRIEKRLTETAYHGPSSGVINWSGKVEQDGLIAIEGLPGIPVMIDFDAKEYAVVEPPSPSNKWKRLVLRSRRRKDAVISVRWTAIQ